MTPIRSLRVLIVAENVSMTMGGEASLAYYYAKLFSERGVETWIACHERCKAEVTQRLPSLASRTRFVPDTAVQRWLVYKTTWLPYRVRDLIVGQFVHMDTQRKIRGLARELASSGRIDVVFEPAPITPKGLSYVYDVGVPVVIGPMCGGMDFPPAFRHLDTTAGRWMIWLGRVAAQWANRLVPGKLRADVLLVANEQTRRALPRGVKGRVLQLFESGVDLDIWRADGREDPLQREVRFVFSGRFIDLKGIQFLIPAFKRAATRNGNCVLELVGGGGEFEGVVKALADDPALQGRVRLHGWVSRERAAEILRGADVFVMPSLRECGGTAILEAMALGKPVIGTAWGGPADYIDETCGILVAPSGAEPFIDGLADAIVSLTESPSRRKALGEGARQRIQRDYLTWDAKAQRLLEILSETAASRDDPVARPAARPGRAALGATATSEGDR
jgi:glycosyltransferase involved in cell wall biosynthesis